MNKKYLYYGLGGAAVVGIVGVVLAFVLGSKVPKSARLLDENAMVVARIDAKQMIQKSGLADDGKAKAELEKLIKKYADDEAKFINDLIDDPGQTGIDFAEPMFVSASSGNDGSDVRFVGSVKSDKDLTKFLEDINEKSGSDDEIEEKDGYHCMLGFSSNYGYSAFVYNDDFFMLRECHKSDGDKMDAEDVIDDVKDYFEGKKDNELLDDKSFKEMCKRDGVAQLLIRGKGLAEVKQIEQGFDEAFPDRYKLEDLAYLFDAQVNNGEVVLTGEFLPGSDVWEEKFKETEDFVGDIEAEYADYISKENAMLIVNLKGEKIAEQLKKGGMKKQMGSNDWKMLSDIIKSIDGDVAFALNKIADNGIPSFNAYGHTVNNKLVSLLAEELEDASTFNEQGTNKYSFKIPNLDMELLFGYDKKSSYFVFGQDNLKAFGKANKAFSKDDIKGRGIYAFFNFSVLNKFDKLLDNSAGADAPLAKTAFKFLDKMFDYAEFYFENNKKFVLRLVSEDKDQTPIETLFANLGSFISDMQDAQQEAGRLRQKAYSDYYRSDSYDSYDSDSYSSYDADSVMEAPAAEAPVF